MAAEITTIEAIDIQTQQQPQQLEFDSASSGEITTETNTNNATARRLRLIEYHFWHGRTLTNYPDLPPGYYALPRQRGALPQGVKFGLVFADDVEPIPRKFVVAFDIPAGKVYAEAGPVGPVDWNVVEVKLGTAGSSVVYDDPILGGRIEAQMEGTNKAKATFSR